MAQRKPNGDKLTKKITVISLRRR